MKDGKFFRAGVFPLRQLLKWLAPAAMIVAALAMSGCQTSKPEAAKSVPAAAPAAATPASNGERTAKRYVYTPRPYPVDERGFSPVDKVLAKAYAREEMVTDDAEGSLNPYVLKVISGFPQDGSYPYHCSWTPREYDIYNGVTQDMWCTGKGGREGLSGRVLLQILLRVYL